MANLRIFNARPLSSDGLIINDGTAGVVVDANPAVCAMHGYTHEEFVGLHATDFIHRDYHHIFEQFRQVILAGGTYQTQALDIRKDGSSFHVEVHGSQVLYEGRPHILAVVRDVTERVQARELLEQRVRERTRELAALLEVSQNVTSTLELQPLLGLVLDQLGAVVEYTGAGIAVEDGELVRVIAYRGPDADDHGPVRLPVVPAAALWRVLRRGELVRIQDVLADTEEARIYRESAGEALHTSRAGVRSWMAVPMRVKDRDIGSLFLEHEAPCRYTEHHISLALAIAQQAAIAIENARLYERAHAVAALEERQRLARELHDSVSQALYAIGLGVRTAQSQLTRSPARVEETLSYLHDVAQTGLAEMRSLILELLPETLQKEGLVAALGRQVAAVQARHGLAISVALGSEPDAPVAVKEALYRIASEALHNTVKHADARTVELRLDTYPGELLLELRDDGRGFDTEGSFPGHLGLRTMRDRALRLGGSLDLMSAPGCGTTIRARIPSRAAGEARPQRSQR